MPRHKGSKPRNPYADARSVDERYIASLEDFHRFCRTEDLPFKETLIDAARLFASHWFGADARERREFRKKLRRAA
jgi:hypothetical protein